MEGKGDDQVLRSSGSLGSVGGGAHLHQMRSPL